jgi:uncharacterized membrane protein YfcA
LPAKLIVLLVMGGFAVFYLIVFVNGLMIARREGASLPTAAHIATGFGTNFLDTLGIGSFATSTSIFKFTNMVPDQLIPGTLNAGHTLPVIFQAFIYMAAIDVDVTTLVLLIAAAVVGAWFGAGLVARLSKRAVQLGMGFALLAAVAAMLASQLALFPAGGTDIGLSGWRLVVGIAGNFTFAAVSTLGIGFYAPCMTMVSLLGMNPAVAFPIMMGSGAFLMPVASARFVWRKAYFAPVAAGLAVGGLLGVPVAAFVVKSLALGALRWLVIVVVTYAAVLMLRSAGASTKSIQFEVSSKLPVRSSSDSE